MPAFNFQYSPQKIPYFLSGNNPQLLIVSGTHGDEFAIISSLDEIIQKYIDDLVPFMYIPELSPSAVRQKTRTNSQMLI